MDIQYNYQKKNDKTANNGRQNTTQKTIDLTTVTHANEWGQLGCSGWVDSLCSAICLRRVWRYQRGNQNPYFEEEQTTQWPKEKGQTTIYKTYTIN